MKLNKIFYNPSLEGDLKISPSKNHIPDWYKTIKPHTSSNISFQDNLAVKNVKSCIPFLDCFTSGYIAELWSDIHFKKNEDGSHFVTWSANHPIGFRGFNPNAQIAIPFGHSKEEYTWMSPFFIKLPKGYSALITHPFNRYDLPFTTISGIVDGTLVEGNVPFYIKEDFEGIIEAGTPVFQIFPFKTENWKIEKNPELKKDNIEYLSKAKQKFFGYYKNNVWVKKDYS